MKPVPLLARCMWEIEKPWPGDRSVLSRRRCKRMVPAVQPYCWQHRSPLAPREALKHLKS